MFKRLKRVVCAAAAVVVMAAVSVTAAADHTYQLSGDGLCDEILASSQEINGTEGTFETSFSSENRDNYVSLRFKLFNEFLDPEFWNDDSVTVSVEVKLETEGVDIIGCIPAFNSKWNWIDPSGYTNLKYGEWVTVSEKGTHFYPGFSDGKPGYLLFQARNNWGKEAPGLVKVSVRNFQITGGSAEQTTEPPETTTPAETDPVAPAETDPVVPAETDPPAPVETNPVTVENAPGTAEITQEITAEHTAENTAENSGEEKKTAEASAPEEPAQTTANTTTSTPKTTTIVTQATAATSEKIDYNSMYETESPVKMIVIIVVIAAVVSLGAVVGYLIYKKKKYY